MKSPRATRRVTAAGAALGTIAGLQGAANALLAEADQIREHGDRMQTLAAELTASQANTNAADRAVRAARDGEARTRAEAARYQRPIGWIPERIRQGIAAHPATYVRDGGRWVRLGRIVGKGVPFAGTTLAVGAAATDVAMGKSARGAVTEAGAGLAGGVVGGELGAAVGSVIFPGVGTVVGGIAGGIIGSMVASEGVTHVIGQGE